MIKEGRFTLLKIYGLLKIFPQILIKANINALIKILIWLVIKCSRLLQVGANQSRTFADAISEG